MDNNILVNANPSSDELNDYQIQTQLDYVKRDSAISVLMAVDYKNDNTEENDLVIDPVPDNILYANSETTKTNHFSDRINNSDSRDFLAGLPNDSSLDDNNSDTLTNDQVDMILDTAREMDQPKPVIIDPECEDIVIDADENGLVKEVEEDFLKDYDIDIFDINKEEIDIDTTAALDTDRVRDTFDLSDDDVVTLLEVIGKSNEKNYDIYNHLPKSIQGFINDMIKEQGIPEDFRDTIAKMIISEMTNQSEVQQAFIDLEKSLNKALDIPSLADLYSEHTESVMEVHIPEMIEKIRDEAPDKAEMLEKVREVFHQAYDFSFAMNAYNNNARIRKSMRRQEQLGSKELRRALDNFCFRNESSRFKINDIHEVPDVLKLILIEELQKVKDYIFGQDPEEDERYHKLFSRRLELNVTEKEIEKFCIMIAKSCETKDPYDVIDASYMYYLVKNLIVLKFTNESKTDFSIKLINNICDAILFIRTEEAKFNERNLDQSKPRKKRNNSDSCKKSN